MRLGKIVLLATFESSYTFYLELARHLWSIHLTQGT